MQTRGDEKKRCAMCGKFKDNIITMRGRRVCDAKECRDKALGVIKRFAKRPAVENRVVQLTDFQIRADATGNEPQFEGYANRWQVVDSYGTRFQQGAFTRGGLDSDPYPLLFMHDPFSPIGAFSAREDASGLYVSGSWDDTDTGQRARGQAKNGSAPELSVGFVRLSEDPDDTNLITSAKLAEVSQITRRMASTPGSGMTAIRRQLATRAADPQYAALDPDVQGAIWELGEYYGYTDEPAGAELDDLPPDVGGAIYEILQFAGLVPENAEGDANSQAQNVDEARRRLALSLSLRHIARSGTEQPA